MVSAAPEQPDWHQVEQENPGLSVRTARLIGEGWNARAWLVNDELVFRCPKRVEHWEELEREIAFLRFAGHKLPLPVPEYVQTARSSAAPYGYAVYRYLQGEPMDLDSLHADERETVAAKLADFLRALHALKPTDIFLPREDEYLNARQYLDRAEREVVPHLSRPAAAALLNVFEAHLGRRENFSFTPAVLHADFSRDHILMEKGVVTGVIDFGDVNWGDPDYDFMYLYVDCGESFAEHVARRYGHPDFARLRVKLRYFALTDQIDMIVNGADHALEGQQRAAWSRIEELLKSA